MTSTERKFTSVEICAGAGGQAVGLHNALFKHLALIEIDKHACATLRSNVDGNDEWEGCEVVEKDLTKLSPQDLEKMLRPKLDLVDGASIEGELDLLAGGVPCPPFSAAGRQLGRDDERDLFPTMLDLVDHLKPKTVMIENVRGILEPREKFREYRENYIEKRLRNSGYVICDWKLMEACDFGVPQLRPRAILIAMLPEFAGHFVWPDPADAQLVTVAKALGPSMRKRFGNSPEGKGAYEKWRDQAKRGVAPTLVGGSKKHGGADLGPTRAKKAWLKLGVDGMGVANEPEKMTDPERDLFGPRGPKLTVKQAALIQGFPVKWKFTGLKTAAYRQVGNAFPPPVAEAMGRQIVQALEAGIKNPLPESSYEQENETGVLFEIPGPSELLPAQPLDRSHDLESAVVG